MGGCGANCGGGGGRRPVARGLEPGGARGLGRVDNTPPLQYNTIIITRKMLEH